MCEQKLREIDKIKLTGRIYPAIQSCVGNRYRILIGIFAYYGFLLTKPSVLSLFQTNNINLYVSFFFALCIIHNTYNYVANAYEQYRIEGKKEKRIIIWIVEGAWVIIAGVILVVAFYYFKNPEITATLSH
jgi:magnesium-transporting ATPase (P-type)